ncbi:MAG: deoxynucleoside kinase, partial [Candidatus Omnitrophica bacterium]|nr:deoxynucleoside kinase [Candidatus Omnitrophota bacterium]
LNALKCYYEDSSFIFPFQILATSSYMREAIKSHEKCDQSSYWISERNILTAEKIFVMAQQELGKLTIEEVAIHEYLTSTFIDLHPELIEFDYVIYLKTPPNICFESVQNRKRVGEFDSLMKEYLQLLDDLYEEWSCSNFAPLKGRKYIELDRQLPTRILVEELCEKLN